MGVHGLWRLIEPSGKPVPLETLENKVLAVDVSIWLHQIVKGFQDSKGAPLPNAHLLGIYHRVCKLLYFRIKPVFVFDGGVPVLKKQTIAKRNQQKVKTLSEADRIHRNLLSTLLKHTAISKVLSEKAKAAITSSTSPTKKSKKEEDDLYMLPPSQSLDSTISSSEDEENSSSEDSGPVRQYDLHSIDTESIQFKSLPVDVRHEILTDLKETRKQSSWGRIHELPTESDGFSGYQMRRLLKRQSVQNALEAVEKEMGGHSLSLGELEEILKDQGVITKTNIQGNRIASDENTRFLLIKDLKQAVEEAKKQSELPDIAEETSEAVLEVADEKVKNSDDQEFEDEKMNKADQEFEDDLQKAIALSLEEAPSTSKPISEVAKPTTEEVPKAVKIVGGKGKNRMPLSFLKDFEDADFDDSGSSEEEIIQTKFTSAQKYMMEYTTLTSSQINRILASKSGINKKPNVEEEKEVTKESTSTGTLQPNDNIEETHVIDITNDEEPKLTESDIEENNIMEMIKVTDQEKLPETELQENKKEVTVIEVNNCINEDNKQVPETEVTNKQDAVIEEEKVTEPSLEENAEAVEVMSDSESSNSDDFLDVEETPKEKLNPVESMEVVIKPDEAIEDDIFKDIFEEPSPSVQVEEKENENTEAIVVGDKEPAESNFEQEKEEKKTGNMKDKIQKMIKEYSRVKANEETGEKTDLSVERMNEMRDNLRKEEMELVTERSNKERLAGNITDQMYQEAQELLELFGVPYLIAPMEAEAQCAFLDLIDLTDGTITDDSDIWLFGGRTVYKNFFNHNKTVLEFKYENIQHHYKLTREQMILLAMLVGSDYTVGLTGVGPVTALEILAAFPPKNHLVSGLAEFKAWFNKGQLPGPSRTSLRSKLKNLNITENFPNPQIAQAYLEPRVETSEEKFTWAKPDVIGLVEFARQKFGWTKAKTEEILKPILKRVEDHNKQKSILNYFKRDFKVTSDETEKKMSKRVKTAISKIGKNSKDDGEEEEEPKPKRKRQVTAKAKEQKQGDEAKLPRKKRQSNKKPQEVDADIEILKQTEERSQQRVEEIHNEVLNKIEEKPTKKVDLASLHRREVIPQKQKDKTDMLKNKMKAIETFRKSKQGPGYVKKRGKVVKAPKENASYLSESSDSE